MNQAINLFSSATSLLLLVVLLFWLYRQYIIDSFRQKIFRLRDDLFDEAAHGRIDFSSPAYGMMRSTMNGILRFGHRLNIPLTISLFFFSAEHKTAYEKRFSDRINENTKSLTDEQKKLITSYHQKMNFFVLEYLVYSSPLLLFSIVFPLGFAIQAKTHIHRLLSAARKPLDKIDTMALVSAET